MAGLLEAGAELTRQRIDIVAQVPRRLPEGAIRHEQRPGRVIGETEKEQPIGDRIAELRLHRDALHFLAQLELHELVGELKGAAGGGQGGIDGELTRACIIGAHERRIILAEPTAAAMALGKR
jgi:hypothetical protein